MISNQKYEVIAELDFSAIKLKLTDPKSGEGWSLAKAEAMETEYRRFLYLQSAFPEEQTAPTLDVDTFWHYHILDTMKYASDCERAFGYFLHHYPYLGLMEGDEPGLEIEAGNRTRELYEATFGEQYIRAEAYGTQEAAGDKCQGTRSAVEPKASGVAAALCQGYCTAARPTAISTAVKPKVKASTLQLSQSAAAQKVLRTAVQLCQ